MTGKNIPTLSRRNVLRSIPAAGAVFSFGELTTGLAEAADASDVVLGEFEDGLDGWTTSGGTMLTRVDEDEMPAAVQVGTHALGVELNGDLRPMIENKRRVREADFLDHPYLLAHVLGYADNTDSDMVFKFRLHHTHTPAAGQDDGGRGRGGEKDVLVVESDEQTVAQLTPQYIRWDLSTLDEEIRQTANRLEIVWYLEKHPPDDDHRGRARGDFDYRGVVAVDNIRLTDDVGGERAQASREKRMALHREHGMIADRTVEERTQTVERGTLIFVDHSEVPYSFEVLDDGRFQYMIDGETFLLGGEGDE